MVLVDISSHSGSASAVRHNSGAVRVHAVDARRYFQYCHASLLVLFLPDLACLYLRSLLETSLRWCPTGCK